jgi:hypothetical protein
MTGIIGNSTFFQSYKNMAFDIKDGSGSMPEETILEKRTHQK